MAENLDVINQFAGTMEVRFSSLETLLLSMDTRLEAVEKRLDNLESEVGHMRVNMVAKEYVDDKLVDFRIFSRKLIDILKIKR